MRFKLLTSGAIAAMCLSSIPAVQAQDLVSCADFVKMDQASQQSTLDQIIQAMPSSSGTASTTSNDQSSNSSTTSNSNASSESGNSTVGLAQVQDACQQNSTMTVNDAVSQIQSTGNSTSGSTN